MHELLTESLQEHLTVLTTAIGPRLTGSPGNHRAAQYLAEILYGCGWEVHEPEFSCLSWQPGEAVLVADAGKVKLYPAPYTKFCDAKGPLVILDTCEQLQTADLAGKVVLLRGDLAGKVLMPKNFPFADFPDDREFAARLEAKNPLGIITASLSAQQPLSIFEDGDLQVAAAVVAGEDLSALQSLAGQTVRLFVGARRRPGKGCNVIGRRYGEGRKVVLTAHFDSKGTGVGALDNAAGCALILALAQYWQNFAPMLPLELALLNGEDYYSCPGQVLYAQNDLAVPDHYQLAVNVDGVGLQGSRSEAASFNWPPLWQQQLTASFGARFDVYPSQPWPQGDHMLFAARGIPTLAVTSAGIFDLLDEVIHTVDDGPDLVDVQLLAKAAAWIHSLLLDLPPMR